MLHDKRILLVDDDPFDRELISESLKDAGIVNKIDFANDGVEAIEYLFERGLNKPILVLLDIKMPRLGGMEVLKRIKDDNDLKIIPVVMLTSSKEDVDVYKSYEYQANGFVCKPVNFSDFQDVVKRIGLYWCLSNETAF
ncbi:MAG: two-component system response regulator [Denitrovibrio sp.]|nr:MAG: two-component system response regulator [Denitrovibrio sp.]